jgi:hypothetical protein
MTSLFTVLRHNHGSQPWSQRTCLAYLGLMDEAGRLGIERAADPQPPLPQRELCPEPRAEPRFVEIDRASVRVKNCRQFGGPWLALELIKQLGLHDFLKQNLRTEAPATSTASSVLRRLLSPTDSIC